MEATSPLNFDMFAFSFQISGHVYQASNENEISFAEMIVLNLVYNKVSVEYGFNVTREVKNMYFSFVASPLMKYKYFSLHS